MLSKLARKPQVASILKSGVELRAKQEAAAQKLLRQDGNLLLSHPVGSGKTITAIAGFDRLRLEGKAKRALVVTPASLRRNFAEEGVGKFTSSRVAIFGNTAEVQKGQGLSVDTPDPKADFHVVSYDLFRKDPEKFIRAAGADTVIYDELHKIKNIGITGEAIKKGRKFHRNFIGLTGSIVSNTPADLVPLVDAMTDGKHHLGTKENFERRFVSEDGKMQNSMVVRHLLNPYIHHVDPSAAEGTPRKQIETVAVEMSPEQQELYQYVIGKMDPVTALKFRFGSSKLKTNDVNNIFHKMTQARQVANAIHTINKSVSLDDSAKRSPKITKVLDDVQEHLEETPDGQVIVYSNMIQGGVDVLSRGLENRGIAHGIFVGKGQPGSTEASRQAAVRDYQAGKKRVIVLSSAGGEGLNLGDTTFVANVDGHFNPEKIFQAEARGVRAGGQAKRAPEERKVVVRRYVTRVPISKTQVLKDTANLLSPMMMLNRVMEGSPAVYNPFKRERSPDDWAYEVAARKDKRNQGLRAHLDKTAEETILYVEDMLDTIEDGLLARAEDKTASALTKIAARRGNVITPAQKRKVQRLAVQRLPMQPHKLVKSDLPVMRSYLDEMGKHFEDALDPNQSLPASAQPREQEYVDALRDYYREAGKGGLGTSKAKTDAERKKEVIKQSLLSGLAGGLLIGGGMATGGMPRAALEASRGASSAAGNLLLRSGAAGAAGAALVGVPLLWTGLREPVFGTPAARAKRMSRMTDDQMRQLLRGLEVRQVEKKIHNLAVGSNARAKTVRE